MHKMMHEKHMRQEQIRADQAAVDRIDATIKTNIQPCLVSCSRSLSAVLAAQAADPAGCSVMHGQHTSGIAQHCWGVGRCSSE